MKKFKFITACVASVMSLVLVIETGSYISGVNSTVVVAAENVVDDDVEIAVIDSTSLGVSALDFLNDVDSDLITEESVVMESNQEIELILNDAIVELKVDNSKSVKEVTEEKEETTEEEDDSASDDDNNNNLEYVGNFKVTAYCSCSRCCGKSNGITASGKKATAGRTIAADTSKFPLGTKLVFNNHTYVVEDTGGSIRGNRIDLYMSSHQEALNWGVRYCDVYIEK